MRLRTLLICLLALVALPALASPRADHKHHPRRSSRNKPKGNAKELRQKLGSVRAQIHKKRVAIREVKKEERHISSEIHVVESRLLKTEGHLGQVKGRLKELGKQQKELAQRITVTQTRLDRRRTLLARRMRDNYERGNASYLDVLLKSRTVHDYVSRSYYVDRIVESDNELVRGIKLDKLQLEQDKRKLDSQAQEQKQLRQTLEEESVQYRDDVDKKRDLLDEVHQSREQMEEALDELERSSSEIEERIRSLARTPAGRARMLRAWTGHFIKPASGPITSGFGSRYHPILHKTKMHTGVDIGAGYGASIHAAADGVVIMASYMRGYGNCVIIDHGGGVSTLYGHCSSLGVSEGQSVRQGETIARVGATGLATGPHLHFEVRRNGTPVNPM